MKGRELPEQPGPALPKRGYTVDEAVFVYSIPRTRLEQWIASAEISVCVIGGGSERRRVVLLAEDIEAALRRKRVPARWEP